ncbi:unnamed protein product [Kuraishia capsulata CBS 1993]|uniref:Uncharacterized protein n=1 Tax=Kuraishia capsulata CBS 1993 TaxID=1382522 RepID=W6MLB7_9ASCO|nr:uncharacterized protein KUCA_T00001552001 [Kuraishia capsulata CBS 1993]CDK25582.1 unnamed protein product [Kuraishia capsulata CBS 1993]
MEDPLIPNRLEELDHLEYQKRKSGSLYKIRSLWSSIIEKYSAFDEEDQGDLIDLSTGRIVDDTGHVKSMRDPSSGYISVWHDYFDQEERSIASTEYRLKKKMGSRFKAPSVSIDLLVDSDYEDDLIPNKPLPPLSRVQKQKINMALSSASLHGPSSLVPRSKFKSATPRFSNELIPSTPTTTKRLGKKFSLGGGALIPATPLDPARRKLLLGANSEKKGLRLSKKPLSRAEYPLATPVSMSRISAKQGLQKPPRTPTFKQHVQLPQTPISSKRPNVFETPREKQIPDMGLIPMTPISIARQKRLLSSARYVTPAKTTGELIPATPGRSRALASLAISKGWGIPSFSNDLLSTPASNTRAKQRQREQLQKEQLQKEAQENGSPRPSKSDNLAFARPTKFRRLYQKPAEALDETLIGRTGAKTAVQAKVVSGDSNVFWNR